MVDTLQEFDLAQRQQAPERQLAALAELRKTPGPGAAYLLRAARICEGTGRCCSECSVRTTCKLAGHLISTRPSCEHRVCPHAARTPCFTGRGKNASTRDLVFTRPVPGSADSIATHTPSPRAQQGVQRLARDRAIGLGAHVRISV